MSWSSSLDSGHSSLGPGAPSAFNVRSSLDKDASSAFNGRGAFSVGSLGPEARSSFDKPPPSGFMGKIRSYNQTTGALESEADTTPSEIQQTGNDLERFQEGGQSSMGAAVDNFGNNPETYGYLFNKASVLSGVKQDDEGGYNVVINEISVKEKPEGFSRYIDRYLRNRYRRKF